MDKNSIVINASYTTGIFIADTLRTRQCRQVESLVLGDSNVCPGKALTVIVQCSMQSNATLIDF